MADLVWIMSQLKDINGNIKIDGLLDLVKPVTEEERKRYESIDFDMVRIYSLIPLSKTVSTYLLNCTTSQFCECKGEIV
ncbi:unnamed protein product [Toxocara canis]|uniref:Aldo_ket_red domain-containing protein n=1 Tax=Toxocara canis TaxID=6265 RepID=A0A183U5C7_TOXCA|nr:unnamed protein product [Toxocara canis]